MGETDYKVILSPRAIGDLEEIGKFIAPDDSAAAERFGFALIDQAEAIGAHPEAGRTVPEFRDAGIRERIFRAYRIVYQVDHERRLIIISRFWHAARGMPEVLKDDGFGRDAG